MVNAYDQIYVERLGKLERTQASFADNSHLLRIIDKIVSQIGRRVDEASPMVDARLPDGSRVNAIIPPLALKGPTLTIRKFARDPYTMNDLISFGSISPKAAQFLAACVKGKLNVLISGGTGTGKTTTLNAMSAFIPGDERIVTIEDAAELQLQQEHVITLESRPPNIEGQGEVRIRELVRNALRMRPDRIIVGEVRGPETLDMLQAMNTGHEGSLTTIHANSPRDALSRLETLVLTAGVELPLRAIREQVSSAFDLLVQITRLVDGSRRISHVTEVLRMESEVITLQDIFHAKPPDEQTASSGVGVRLLTPLACSGLKPNFLDKMAANGVMLQSSFFSKDDDTDTPVSRPGPPGLEVQGSISMSRFRLAVAGPRVHHPRTPGRRSCGCAASRSRRDRLSDHPRVDLHAERRWQACSVGERHAGRGLPGAKPRERQGDRHRDRPLAVHARQAAGRRFGRRARVRGGKAGPRRALRHCLRLEGVDAVAVLDRQARRGSPARAHDDRLGEGDGAL